MSHGHHPYLISYGPDANCVLDKSSPFYCPLGYSVYGYLPALGASITFMVCFFLALVIQIFQGLRWRTWWFTGAMVIGCVSEVAGYGGRIMLYQNPFSFTGFMIQIIMITLGPAFYSAAIYFTLAKIVVFVGREYSRLPPAAYYWIFISCDIVSLSLQATGGALSSTTSGGSKIAVDISIAGLSSQVITLSIFIALAIDYALRFRRGRNSSATKTALSRNFKVFVVFLSAAIIFILIRCGYRIAELKGGYIGPGSELIRDQGLFIALEGVLSALAAFCLCVAHPGPVFAERLTSGSEGRLSVSGQGGFMSERERQY